MACKRGSPLILGIREAPGVRRSSFTRLRDASDTRWRQESIECFIASDASAVIEHTKKCVERRGEGVMLHAVLDAAGKHTEVWALGRIECTGRPGHTGTGLTCWGAARRATLPQPRATPAHAPALEPTPYG